MIDDVVLNKAGTIERCLARGREEFGDDGGELAVDQRRRDALLLNLLRACETAIDLAMHAVRVRGLGAPQSSRDAFEKLVEAGLLDLTSVTTSSAWWGSATLPSIATMTSTSTCSTRS